MKKQLIYIAAMSGLMFASCAEDEIMSPISDSMQNRICYTVASGNGSRATSGYENGTDVNKITVSAWAVAPEEDGTFALPGYDYPNTGNASIFTNDELTRTGVGTKEGQGTFNYGEDARFWPKNGELVDFFAVVDAPVGNRFDFDVDGKPGLVNTVMQEGKDKMPDMLYATTFDQKLTQIHAAQQNVSFHFDHAFAKVVITAQVKNKNLYVVITDAELYGITGSGEFAFPYKSGEGTNHVFNEAQWTVDPNYTKTLSGLLDGKEMALVVEKEFVVEKEDAEEGEEETEPETEVKVVVDKEKKFFLTGEGVANDVLVIPNHYDGRDASKFQTGIKLKGYAYNLAGEELDEDTDFLVYGTKGDNGPEPADIIIPIEFDWKRGTINTYNIIFDCGTGGTEDDDPNNPALVRIGYEVEVNDWIDGESTDDEFDFAHGKPVGKEEEK